MYFRPAVECQLHLSCPLIKESSANPCNPWSLQTHFYALMEDTFIQRSVCSGHYTPSGKGQGGIPRVHLRKTKTSGGDFKLWVLTLYIIPIGSMGLVYLIFTIVYLHLAALCGTCR